MNSLARKIIFIFVFVSGLSGCASSTAEQEIAKGALYGASGGVAGAGMTGMSLFKGGSIGFVSGGLYQADS